MDCNLFFYIQLVRHTRIEINLPSPYFLPDDISQMKLFSFPGNIRASLKNKSIKKEEKPTAEKKFSKSRIFHILESRVGARDDKKWND